MGVVFKDNKYHANFNKKRAIFSVDLYGPKAKILAEMTYNEKRKVHNYIEEFDDYCVAYAYTKTFGEMKCKIDKDQYEFIKYHKNKLGIRQQGIHVYITLGDEVLHRVITDAKSGDIVDHINGDTLDNRKINLRICDYTVNNINTHVINSNTGIKGISRSSKDHGYNAYIGNSKNGKYKFFTDSTYGGKENALNAAIKWRKEQEELLGYNEITSSNE